jgi:hypothetical protein
VLRSGLDTPDVLIRRYHLSRHPSLLMNKVVLSALLAIPSIAAGSAYLTPPHVLHADYKLVDQGLVIVPVENQEFADDATKLYFDAAGFDGGTVSTLNMPEVVSGGTLDDAVKEGVQQLVTQVESDYQAGDLSPTDPLYIFGYSQSSVVMGMAEQQLHDYGIPQQDLNLVMVGDSASAEGGFLNSYLGSLPSWLQPYVVDALNRFGAGSMLGATTPDNLYPTEVYSLSGDGWANYDGGLHDLGMYSDHLEYLGLTPSEVAAAGPPVIDGLTQYFTIQDSMVNSIEALWTQLQMAVSIF